jgi:hypothetical protein
MPAWLWIFGTPAEDVLRTTRTVPYSCRRMAADGDRSIRTFASVYPRSQDVDNRFVYKCRGDLTTRSSGPWGIVGRVWPRHGHRGRPLNSVVIRQSVRAKMHSQSAQRRAANHRPSASICECSSSGASGASVGWGVVVALTRASAEHRFCNRREGSAIIAVSGLKLQPSGLRFSARRSVACGHVTYNNAFERTKLWATRSALYPLAAQLGR